MAHYQPRKDRRKRDFPASLNDTKIKRYFRKRVRLAAKKSDEPLNGNIGRKMNERWDINDFK
jgi:hypothetical protein